MLKRLRRNFVIVIMVIVTVLFATVFGFVLHQTKQNLERESIQMMRTLVFRPHDAAMGRRPDEKPSGRVTACSRRPASPAGASGEAGAGLSEPAETAGCSETVVVSDVVSSVVVVVSVVVSVVVVAVVV